MWPSSRRSITAVAPLLPQERAGSVAARTAGVCSAGGGAGHQFRVPQPPAGLERAQVGACAAAAAKAAAAAGTQANRASLLQPRLQASASLPLTVPAALPLWPCCSELLLFLLPLVNAKAIKHAVRSYLPRLPMLGGPGAPGGGALQQHAEQSGSGGQCQQQPCGICSTTDVLDPYAAVPCGHCFCYYCLRSNCLADPEFACPLCLRRVDAMRQLGGGAGLGPGSVEAAAAAGIGGVDGGPRALEKSELSLAGWLAG